MVSTAVIYKLHYVKHRTTLVFKFIEMRSFFFFSKEEVSFSIIFKFENHCYIMTHTYI